MSYDPSSEVGYRLRLASEHLKRAERLHELGDWAGAVQFAQLAIENYAKAVIAVFETPTWSHDPSGQLRRLLARLPTELEGYAAELAELAHRAAPEHGRSTYGEPGRALTPSEIYGPEHAQGCLEEARRARYLAELILKAMGVA